MKTSVSIQNLKCRGCESTIIKRLNSLAGIHDISINLDNSTVSFTYETNDGIETVQKVLSKLGYPLEGDSNPLRHKAKSYLNCAIGKLSN